MRAIFLVIMLIFSLNSLSDEFLDLKRAELNKNWTSYSRLEKTNIRRLLELLKSSEEGARLLSSAEYRASKWGMSLIDCIKVGNTSLTDTTLTRKFTAGNPFNVSYESRSVIYLNRSLSGVHALLDLAHELVHFTNRKSFNPYVVNFNTVDFVKETIESEGGEAAAFEMECKVAKEFFNEHVYHKHGCHKYEKDGEIDRQLLVEKFYSVGSYWSEFKKMVKVDQLELANSNDVEFYSSAYSKPYPVAAVEEYQQIMSRACANEDKRIELLDLALQRSPAGQSDYQHFDELKQVHSSRCY